MGRVLDGLVALRARVAVPAVTAAAALAFAVVAQAGTTIQDANDTVGPIDIKSASATIKSDGKLKHTVVFFEDVPAKGETGNEYLELWKTKPHALKGAPAGAFKEAPYKIQGPQTGKRDVFTGGEEGAPYKKTGTATVTRKGNKLTFVFSRKAIGSPKDFYYWHVTSSFYGSNKQCKKFEDCTDHAPDGSKAVKQSLQ
jgi:hypothetical protein